jgi:hypothetical protein
MPLRSDLRGIGQRIVEFYRRGGDPPYLLYVYEPADEWVVRRDLKDLQLWMEAPDQSVRCAAISLADLFWQALDAEGWIDELVSQERAAAGDPAALQDVYRAVGEILRLPPSLPDRVIDLDRRPQKQAAPPRHAALPRHDRRRLRSQVHGADRARLRL